MSAEVMLVVLFAALLHASWNALIKSGGDKLVGAVMLSTAAGAVALAALPFLPLPLAPSWPYLLASVALHCAYFCLVAFAYRAGDMSLVYPVMRGSAPLLTALYAVAFLGEPLGAGGWAGVLLLSGGILGLTREHLRAAQPQGRALALGLVNAVVIAAFTLCDGLGARAAGSAWSYVLWMFFLNAFPLLAIGLALRPHALLAARGRAWSKALLSGSLTVASYALVLWAMTRAPIPLVAALRETSVLFGTALAALLLRERFGRARWVAAGVIAAGAAVMKIA